MTIQARLFDADSSDRQLEADEVTTEFVQNLSERQLLWVDVSQISQEEAEQLQPIFELHRQSVENLVEPLRWPRFDNYGTYFQMNVIAVKSKPATHSNSKSPKEENSVATPDNFKKVDKTKPKIKTKHHTYQPIELDLICGKNYVLTSHAEAVGFLESFSEHLKGDSQVGELDALAFLASLLDWQLSSYLEVTNDLELEIDRLDEYALSQANNRSFLTRLTVVRRQVSEVRRMLNPHRQAFSMLARPDFEVVAKSDSAAYFRGLNSRLERVVDIVENAREMIIGSFDLYMTGTAQNTNETMKILTLGTIVLGLIAAVAGIMGVNFDLDLFKTGITGFLVMLGVMFGLTLVIFGIARQRHWL